jgi:hypothetical protein
VKVTTAIVYVQLGENPSKTLIPFATHSFNSLENSLHILLTDLPKKWSNFPGQIVDISGKTLNAGYQKFEQEHKELKRVSGGYWLNTLKRLYVLEIMTTIPFEWDDMIHYESDIYPLITQEIIDCLRSKISSSAVPRFSDERGIASLLYIRNKKSLIHFIEGTSQILCEQHEIRDDMELLGAALNKSVIEELPSIPKDAWSWGDKRILFDGAAYGQFLFGQDPFHTNGKITLGYKNPSFPLDISLGKWSISKEGKTSPTSLKFNYLNQEYEIANLHVHSKLLLTELSQNNSEWANFLDVANGDAEQLIYESDEISVHSVKPSLLTRFLIARKKGLLRTMASKLLRMVGILP